MIFAYKHFKAKKCHTHFFDFILQVWINSRDIKNVVTCAKKGEVKNKSRLAKSLNVIKVAY